MASENGSRPAKAPEHGAVRKHDQLTVTDEEDRSRHDRYFDDDGYKVTDVEFVGERAPDTDPDDRAPAREPKKSQSDR
jgi:hypothetical protein